MDERDLELELWAGALDLLARMGAPEEELRPLRERLWALRLFRMMPKPQPPSLWSRPLFWTVLALLLGIVASLLGLPVHKLFP
ncbi:MULTISPECIES: hypothetical protein [Thermus]|uniref:Uncharacterized protein n=2 Tax=Thermus TaxID=270 RepID=A0A430RZR5_THESC|nr:MULTISPECIES: hypothetical protein [Thermus]QWK21733.1 MAG: hypothetical protein KNN15_12100 [Thermus antranikianii]RTH26709.1 hypothetical protein CSW38_05340 [Thermus scotoductus]RTH27168.1 hypothetical protein CSW40_03530 [Thermus scotoductus]RTI41249.1 hypothetical protein CSW18_03725 [Thermus scotoductus]TFU17567.1 hypothetical protein E0489_01960 [Thermus tengchongensis]